MNPLFLYNILRQTLCIILVLAFSNAGFTQNFTTSEDYDNAYSLLLDLKFSKAGELIQNLKASEPQNLAPLYLEDLSDFLYIVVTEDQKEFEARKELRSQRLKALNRLPDSSPYKLLAEGEIHLHWAFSMMRFGEYFNGAMAINKAFKALEKNIEIYPDFLPTYKSMGLLHTLIGTVPDNYRWATNLMGVDGTIELGIVEMEMVIAQAEGKPEFKNLRKETLFLLSFLHINLLNDSEALKRYQKEVEKENGPLMDFAKASLYKENGQANKAIDVLLASSDSRNAFPYLNYLLGELKLAKMDQDASSYLITYTQSFKGQSYIKSALQKIAWHSLLTNGDEKMYRSLISKVDNVGSTMLDEDKSAQKEFDSGEIPNRVLLKARLQFDGGFYQEALKTLITSKTSDLTTADERLEFTYRLGRIHHELGNQKEATSYYKMTIENGADNKRYFAANSSLMLGLIYESSKQKSAALKAFEACSEFNNSEYRNSINQKAKAGILRLKN